ncbi:MAG: hypothetical protein RLZZ60_1030 [Bacteroidota bacterium]|jgi:hypothetical protein
MKYSIQNQLTKFLSITILITSFIITFGACNNKKSKKSTENTEKLEKNDFTKTLEGYINNQHEIIMILIKQSKSLTGTYKYKNKKNSIKLVGRIDDNDNITMNEFNNKGNITGNFKGQLIGDNFIGIWSKPDGNNSMPFQLKVVSSFKSNSNNSSISYDSVNQGNIDGIALPPADAESIEGAIIWTGTFRDEFGRTIQILANQPDNFHFQLTPHYTEDCTEDVLTGTALTIDYNQNVAVFYDNNGYYTKDENQCQIQFILFEGNDEIEIVERNCDHGAVCGTYDGRYTRIK